jgi:hypothetical protein
LDENGNTSPSRGELSIELFFVYGHPFFQHT